jgi:hypothetical protein
MMTRDEALKKIVDCRYLVASRLRIRYGRGRDAQVIDLDYPGLRARLDSVEPVLALEGPPKTGKSWFAMIDLFASALAGLSVLHLRPTQDRACDWVKNWVIPSLDMSPGLRELVYPGGSWSLWKTAGGRIVAAEASSTRRWVGYAFDKLVVDDAQMCDAENVRFAQHQLQSSPYRFETSCTTIYPQPSPAPAP